LDAGVDASKNPPFWTDATKIREEPNRKTREGKDHPDRDAQFRHIQQRTLVAKRAGRAALSVDTKKKETLGKKANVGRELRPKGNPLEVDTHDFPDPELGKAVPYGVYDIGKHNAFVSIGVSKDTAEFAVEAIRRWWNEMGFDIHRSRNRILVTADFSTGGVTTCVAGVLSLFGQ